jgi:pSer/pThr/pTyr-binding forkhead associated (FHA) protein
MIPYQLIMKAGPTPGKIIPLDKAEFLIGRDLVNDIVISDADVSRKHARLVQQGESWLLEDLASTNGCFVNGVRLTAPQLLKPGDRVRLGETVELAFEGVSAAAQVTRLEKSEPVVEQAASAASPAASAAFSAADAAFPRPQEFPDLQMPAPVVEGFDSAASASPLPAYLEAETAPKPSKRNLTIGLIIGGSCLLLLCVCVVVALVVYFGIMPAAQ